MGFAEFFLDPKLLLVPVAVGILFVFAWATVGKLPDKAWIYFVNIELALVPFVFGIVFGSQWLGLVLKGGSGASWSWDWVIDSVVFIGALLGSVISIRQLSKTKNWTWISSVFIFYTLGSFGNLILERL